MDYYLKDRVGGIELSNCIGATRKIEKEANLDEDVVEFLFFKNEDETIDCIEIYTTIGMCSSGYQTASYGEANIHKDIVLPENFSKFTKESEVLFSYSDHGTDSYYPSGYGFINKKNFHDLETTDFKIEKRI